MTGSLFIAVIFCFISWSSSCASGLPPQPTNTEMTDSTTTETAVPTTTLPGTYCARQYSCVNCTVARVCAPTPDGRHLKEIAQTTCPSDRPWCDSNRGVCTYSKVPGCEAPPQVATDFTCMRDGYFPDMTDCTRYYLCHGGSTWEYTCRSPTPYYNPGSQSCFQYSYYCANSSDVCSYQSGYKRNLWAYPLYNLFVYCADNRVVAVDRCIGAYRFDSSQEGCVPYCPHAGLFPRDDDCANYYRCSPATSPALSATSFVMTNLTCPQGQGFLESAYQCVDRSLVPNCVENNPGLFNRK